MELRGHNTTLNSLGNKVSSWMIVGRIKEIGSDAKERFVLPCVGRCSISAPSEICWLTLSNEH